MKKTLVAIYEKHEDASEAVKKLLEGGLSKEHIFALSKGEDTPEKSFEIEKENESILFWGKQGAIWGGLFGLLAGGIFSLVPGFGPIVAAGPVVSSLAGFLGGAATFGSASALAAWLQCIGAGGVACRFQYGEDGGASLRKSSQRGKDFGDCACEGG